MASLIDIRRRIRSVKNTKQITKAMKMIAASRLRRAQDRVIAARPYAATLEATLVSVASRLGAGSSAEEGAAHPLLAAREEKNVVVVVVTGDKGLCGAFNTNVIRTAHHLVKDLPSRGATSVKVAGLGRKGHEFFRRRAEILLGRPGLFQKFGYDTAAEVARDLAARFVSGEVDAVYVVYNEFKSVIAQVVRTKRLLPVELTTAAPASPRAAGEAAGPAAGGTDYLFEPGPDVILGRLLPRHVEFQLYRILLESNAAENAARMTAMDGATRNAGEMIDSLTLIYNRARQARITKELIEIVSGAAALG